MTEKINEENKRKELNEETQECPYENLPLRDNFMFGEVMQKKEICKLFLEALLQEKIANIEYADKEKTMSAEPYYRGIRLDVYLRDDEKTVYTVEMQVNNPRTFGESKKYDLEQRLRYYQSVMDRHTLGKGKHYSKLGKSYIIFVCDFDYLDLGWASYERESFYKDTGVPYEDGSYVFILNAQYKEKNDTPQAILEFLDFIHKDDMTQDFKSELMHKICPEVKWLREDPNKKEAYMTWKNIQEDFKRQGREEGREEGRLETLLEMLPSLREHHSDEEIITKFKYPRDLLLSNPRH